MNQQSLSERSERELAYQAAKALEEKETIHKTRPELIERYQVAANWSINRHECVIHWLRDGNPGHIADFGCGSGEMAVRLAAMGHRVTGFDASPELIELARERARIDGVSDRTSFEVCDFDGANLKGRNFDAVLAMSILHHLPMQQGIDTLAGLLRPGGQAAIMEPVAFTRWLQSLRDATPVIKDVSPDERQLSQADLDLLAATLPFHKVRYFYLLQRLCKVFPPSKFPGLNQALRKIDQFLLAIPGMRKLAGSMVILAKKPL